MSRNLGKLAVRAIVVLVSVLAAACVPANKYAAPAGLAAETAASLVGSKTETSGVFSDDIRTYHVAIDTKLTLAGPHGWDTPVEVSPGMHTIKIGVSRGQNFGFGDTSADFKSGGSYTLHSHMSGPMDATAWIEDGSGAVVSAKVPVKLSAPCMTGILPMIDKSLPSCTNNRIF